MSAPAASARAPGVAVTLPRMATDVASVAQLRDMYLDLLIGSLTHTVYEGTDTIEIPEEARETFFWPIIEAGDAHLVFNPKRARAEGRDWPRYAQTMIGLARMQNVRQCVESVVAEDVAGDLIEAGTWRGGAAILMRGVLKAHGVDDRSVWVADSFAGLPPPDLERYPADAGTAGHEFAPLAVPVDEVREHFKRYGLLDDSVRFVEGWFADTLPELRERQWSVVRVDADMYGSTMDALVNLYDGLSDGGFVIIDDFALTPCRQAVEDFRAQRGIGEPIEEIDWTGVFWRKSAGKSVA
jgi:O-methyltransferase